MKSLGELYTQAKYHIVDTTAGLLVSNPLFMATELSSAGMDDEVSIRSRAYITAAFYLGIGTVFSRGRDVSRKMFNINERGEAAKAMHDSIYSGVFSVPISFLLYDLAKEPDMSKIAIEAAIGVGISIGMGPISGYLIDIGRDLTGLEKSTRKHYNELVGDLGSWAKKGIATAGVAASTISMFVGYAITDDLITREELLCPEIEGRQECVPFHEELETLVSAVGIE